VRILAASVGNCVHTGGIVNFLKIAEKYGYETHFLGPATPVSRLVQAFAARPADIVAVSYRLTPETGRAVLEEVKAAKMAGKFGTARLVFGGTPEVSAIATELGAFDWVVTGGEDLAAIEGWLTGKVAEVPPESHPGTLLERVEWTSPAPLIRHHFGRPTLEETVAGCRQIAEARVLDVLSVAPDQNAQECFFRPKEMRKELTGAGGVPVRKPEDLRALYEASRAGNFPLLRCYAGTRDLVKWAEMLRDTIQIAWGAVPLFWYSQLDGRSNRAEEEAIRENQEAMAWYASQGIPVEVNDAHQWSLRNGHDSVAVAAAHLAAFNAKHQGAKTFVLQLMFNNPPGTSPAMDLAKMLATLEIVESLQGPDFRVLREARSGLASLPLDESMAKGHLGSSLHTMMAVKPHIVHVVGYSEANYAATADAVIESCKIARGAIRNAMLGQPDPLADPSVRARKDHLVREARFLLAAMKDLYGSTSPNPLVDPRALAMAVKSGILDAPQLLGSPAARGATVTKVVSGAWEAVDPKTGGVLSEAQRLKLLGVL